MRKQTDTKLTDTFIKEKKQMASFDYKAYAATVAAAQKKDSGVKIGFFKLADGGEALVRFDVTSLDDLYFASIHRVKRNPEDRFCSMSISCLNPLGHSGECPLCEAVDAGDERVQKAGKRVFVKMLVAYKDASTGAWAEPVPVIWERPAGFYKELMAKLNDYGDLTQHLFKINRSGSSLDTRYDINYAVPAVYKAGMIPADFSAFDGFDITKHSYWEKTLAEVKEYLATGSFPEVKAAAAQAATSAVAAAAAAETPIAKPISVDEDEAPFDTPVDKPSPEEKTPQANFDFGGFSF